MSWHGWMTRKAMHPANTLSYLKRFLSEQMKEETQGRNWQPRWVGLESVVEIVLVVIVQHACYGQFGMLISFLHVHNLSIDVVDPKKPMYARWCAHRQLTTEWRRKLTRPWCTQRMTRSRVQKSCTPTCTRSRHLAFRCEVAILSLTTTPSDPLDDVVFHALHWPSEWSSV